MLRDIERYSEILRSIERYSKAFRSKVYGKQNQINHAWGSGQTIGRDYYREGLIEKYHLKLPAKIDRILA